MLEDHLTPPRVDLVEASEVIDAPVQRDPDLAT